MNFRRSVIIAELRQPEVARPKNFVSNFCVFWGKRSISNCRYCEDRAQNLPGPAPTFDSHCSRLHPNRFTSGGVIAERVKTVEYLQYRLFEPIIMHYYNHACLRLFYRVLIHFVIAAFVSKSPLTFWPVQETLSWKVTQTKFRFCNTL